MTPDEVLIRFNMSRAGMRAYALDCAFSPWKGPAPPSLRHLVACMRGLAVGKPSSPPFWTLCGATGVGKTKSAAMATRAYVEAGGRRAVWIDVARGIYDVMRQRRDHGESELENRILSAELLVLDDLGTEREGRHEQAVDLWIIDRHNRMVTTIVTSNSNLAAENERIWSRLSEGVVITLSGKDRRVNLGS